MAALAIGTHAPDFSISDDAERYALSRFRGTPVVVVFSAGDGDRGQPVQYLSFESERLPVVTCADAAVAARYGVTGRAVFVVSGDGGIVWRHSADEGVVPAPPDEQASGLGRRDFIAATLAVSIAAGFAAFFAAASSAAASPSTAGATTVSLVVNGRPVRMRIDPRVTLLDLLREHLRLTGSKKGCDHGQCGACTVHVDGRRVLSCLTLALSAGGRSVTTIEGLAAGDALHPMQQAFIDHDGFQCGYCTSGQIMSAVALLREPCGASDDDVRECMSGNICRCGAYPGIVAAVQAVRRSEG